jgi:hypothetical protein
MEHIRLFYSQQWDSVLEKRFKEGRFPFEMADRIITITGTNGLFLNRGNP